MEKSAPLPQLASLGCVKKNSERRMYGSIRSISALMSNAHVVQSPGAAY